MTTIFLSQLDVNFDLTYQRLLNSFRGFINGWFTETDKPVVVDKNRGWLMQLETVKLLDPECRMLVCVRDPGQIYGSVETQHQKTLLLDFPDHLANLSRYARADKLFANDGVIGAPLKAIEALRDVPEPLQQRLFYVVFEHLLENPREVLTEIYRWAGLPDAPFDPASLPVKAHESDSYYRFKYPHHTKSRIQPPAKHAIPTRIESEIRENFGWFYQTFYPQNI